MAGASSSKKTSSQEAWLGSEICEGPIEALRHRRMLPPTSQVLVWIPGPETAPTPEEGEIVVFDEHFYRGFGLPASPFFSDWLNFFGRSRTTWYRMPSCRCRPSLSCARAS
ncbi:hypothetical protein D1007_62041 [Hordeum vulgare]|nr:hypothetical protein D1007_62041 [Hordeum vulgare]